MRSFVRRGSLLGLAVVALLAAAAAPLAAQAVGTVRGTVTDAGSQRPLAGAQITIVGSARRAVTGETGEYAIANVPAGPAQVRAEMIGHTAATRSVTVGTGQTARADFALSTSALELDALVVTGTAGATQRRAIGNAVNSISAEELTAKAPITSVTQMLQARAPGLSISPGAGTSGTAAQIRIRGQSSLAGAQIPIFIVDGVRISNVQSGYAVSGQSRNPLDFINPDDIESIEVVKGPAAATLYGAEAANGVIQVITKKGRKGQQGLQWNAKAEYGQIDWTIETPTNWTLCSNARVRNSGSGAVGSFPGCAGVDTTLAAGDERRMISANLLQEAGALRQGDLRNYVLSARGGGDRYSFFVSGDRLQESGVQYNNENSRTSGRANFTVNPLSTLDLAVTVSYARTHSQLPLNDNASNGVLRNAIRGVPGRQGNYGIGWLGLSPAEANIYDNQLRADRFVGGATVNWTPLSWFRNRLVAGVDHNVSVGTVFYPIWRGTAPPPFGVDRAGGEINQFTPERHSYTLDYAGTISNTLPWGDVSSDFSFGAQLNARRYEYTEAIGTGLVSDDVRLVGTAAIIKGDTWLSEQTSLGFFVQEQVGLSNKLFLTGALRVDDNSAFGEDFSTVIYPKLSASYVVSDEPWFRLPRVDNLRLRAAWGQAGNSPAPFSADRTYGGATLVEASGKTTPALHAAAYGNPNLRAETGSEVELGFESSLFDGRAGVDFSYYNKRTFDALIPIPVPPSSGFGGLNQPGNIGYRTRLENAGEIANSGIELSLFGTPVESRALTWEARVGLSTNRNELVDLGGLEPQLRGDFATTQWIREGYPLGSYFGIQVQRNEDGTTKKSANGRGLLSTDTVYIGSSTPTREASLANTLTLLGNLRFYVFADYKGGNYMWNAGEFIRYSNGVSRIGANPALDPEVYAERTSGSTLPFVTRADFVKLREVSVSYTIPQRLTRGFGTDELTFMLSGRNLAMWTNYLGMDPEVNFNGIANTAGFGSVDRSDYMSVPMLRRLQASISARF
ncbi:MAG TPA: SusC/RagA family TonB-linked outer membrane protein [Longimicrobiaceae bacterium]|nr:SusC/RagA family TonB-linked outer membrane protein [Longimicrobiaceae bacterium]